MANSQEYSTMLLEANYDAYVSTMKASIDKFGGDYSDPDFHNWNSIQTQTGIRSYCGVRLSLTTVWELVVEQRKALIP